MLKKIVRKMRHLLRVANNDDSTSEEFVNFLERWLKEIEEAL